jgi:hypothetical protein
VDAAYTNNQGYYFFPSMIVDVNSVYYFLVTKTGYASYGELNPSDIVGNQVNTKNASLYLGSLISGHARAALGGAVIAGTTISANSNDTGNHYNASGASGLDGYYELRQPPGISSLTTSDSRYASVPTRKITLTDKVDYPNVDFDLYVGGAISGSVTFAGTTIPAAGVTLATVYAGATDFLPQSITYTAADGTYMMQHVYPAVNHMIAYGPAGYANAIRYNLTVIDLQTITGINFELQLGGSLDGFVHDYLDQPVNKAVVTIYPASGNSNNQQQFTTGAVGTYSFTGLTRGVYSIRVTPPQGGNLQIAEFSGISLQGSVTVTTRNFILQPGGTLQGTVYDANRLPLAEAKVETYLDMKFPFEKLVTGKTDSAGNYSVDGLSPFQNYTLSITPKASRTELNTAASVKGLTVTENAVRQQDFYLLPAGGRRGVITGAAGNSMNAGSVILLNADHAVSADLEMDGSYVLSYAPEGDYLCIVQNVAGHAQTITDYLHVTAGALEEYNQQLPTGAVIDGYVYDASGNSLAGVKVVAKNKFDVLASLAFFDQTSYTDDTGYYRLEGVAPGTYALQAMPASVDSGGMACRQISNVTVQDKGTYRNNFNLVPGAKVYGSMHDTYGNRTFTGIIMFWSDADPAGVGAVMADQWGNYSAMLAPGTYHSQAYFTSMLGVNLAMEPLAAITVPATPQTLQQEFVMQTGGIISGRITDPNGHPLNLSMVQAYQDDNPLPVRVAFANTGGYYTLKGLHTGTFIVRAQTPGYSTATASVATRIGNSTGQVDLILIPQTSIAGVVQSAQGNALKQAAVQALDAQGTLVLQTATDETGTYVLAPLTGGPFQIKAAAVGLKSSLQPAHYPGDRVDFSLEPLIGHDEAISYPNPCRGDALSFLFWLDEDATALIRVYNQSGELIWDWEGQGIGRQYNKHVWQVSGVAPGVYIFKITARFNNGTTRSFAAGKLTVIK